MTTCLEICLWAFRFLTGACIFSFVNAAICRLPRGESAVKERGRCGAHIRIRAFMAEGIGGAAFVLSASFYGTGKTGVISLRGLLVFLFLAVLVTAAAIDWNTGVICDRFHVIIGLLGLAAVWLFPEITLTSRLAGIVVISVPMLALALLVPGAFGGGDIKLMAACGWLLGWKTNVFAMFAGLLTAGIYCGIMLKTGKLGRKDQFAFGPFLAAGLAAAAFCGEWIGNWY